MLGEAGQITSKEKMSKAPVIWRQSCRLTLVSEVMCPIAARPTSVRDVQPCRFCTIACFRNWHGRNTLHLPQCYSRKDRPIVMHPSICAFHAAIYCHGEADDPMSVPKGTSVNA